MNTQRHAVIVGAGQAGSVVATTLRANGFDGPITLLGDEPSGPYQRPPLSKSFLQGATTADELLLRPLRFYEEQNITLRTGISVASLDRVARQLVTSAGETIAYDALCLATGARPRHLPASAGGQLGNVFTLRNIADVHRLAEVLQPGRRLVVIGGGYLGLEIAATSIGLGLMVTVIEATARLLQRVAAAETSALMRDLHVGKGVTIIENAAVARLTGSHHVTGVELADGRSIPAEIVLVAIGVVPETGLAEAAGLTVDSGIAVDENMQTSDPAIWAAGDCASFVFRGRRQRIESVGNAIDTAEIAAFGMLGQPRAYQPLPWFWSDQYETRLQIAGHNEGYDSVHVRQGPNGVSHWYYRGARLLAVDAVNDSRAYIAGKRLIEMGRSPSPREVTDAAIDLKSLLRPAP